MADSLSGGRRGCAWNMEVVTSGRGGAQGSLRKVEMRLVLLCACKGVRMCVCACVRVYGLQVARGGATAKGGKETERAPKRDAMRIGATTDPLSAMRSTMRSTEYCTQHGALYAVLLRTIRGL